MFINKSIVGPFTLLLLVFSIGCNQLSRNIPKPNYIKTFESNTLNESKPSYTFVRKALLSTNFKTFEELKAEVQIEYFNNATDSNSRSSSKPLVRLTHSSHGQEVISVLKAGIKEDDFIQARDGSIWDKLCLGFSSPYAVINKKNIHRIYILARRKPNIFGEGDIAFYDLAVTMVNNISEEDLALARSEDLTEKGYLNTFNHITAQAFMTSIFSEKLADFIADVHERNRMPELITGKFTEKQLMDIENGPIDNYVDIINNEWGQELGKQLRKKHRISQKTYWTPGLLANYLNDIQTYYSWAFQIGFKPFRTTDEIVMRFSTKINRVIEDVSGMK